MSSGAVVVEDGGPPPNEKKLPEPVNEGKSDNDVPVTTSVSSLSCNDKFIFLFFAFFYFNRIVPIVFVVGSIQIRVVLSFGMF